MIIKEMRKYLKNYQFEMVDKKNIDEVLKVFRNSPYFINSTQNHETSREECLKDMTEIPPETTIEQKTYVLIYQNKKAIGMIDYVEEYPNQKTGYIGLFIIEEGYHRKGMGRELLEGLKQISLEKNFQYLELGCYEENKVGLAFWLKNKFYEIKRQERSVDGMNLQLLTLQLKL